MKKRGRPPYPELLTPREREVLALVRGGLTNEQVADELDISVDAAKLHVSSIIAELGVRNRWEAAAYRERSGLRWLGAVTLALRASPGATAVVSAVVAVTV